jgi:hypothetical protein
MVAWVARRSMGLAMLLGMTASTVINAQHGCVVDPICIANSQCQKPSAVLGTQPLVAIESTLFQAASQGATSDSPQYPAIDVGVPSKKSAGQVPCLILKAVAYTESTWKQFYASPGNTGPTCIASDCGYGVMQITSDMCGSGGFDPNQVASVVRHK